MERFLKKMRGLIGTGLTWALAWVGLGAGVGALTGFDLGFVLRFALSNSIGGFIAGASFAAILSIAERKRTLADLSLRRVALWGAAGGAVVSLLPMAFGMPLAYLLGPLVINGGIGAAMATGSVVMAQRADARLEAGLNRPSLDLPGGP